MNLRLLQDRLASYQCATTLEEERALREITQEVVLAALGRGDFFKHALFQGGTCLRVFHGLGRFSEDLDFLLRVPNGAFRLDDHLTLIADELRAFGYAPEITARGAADAVVRKAFIKDESIGALIDLRHRDPDGPGRKIRVKLQVDTNPPAGGGATLHHLDFPFVSAVACQDLPSLFAGKAHALLCRAHVKGRDWYDFLWYTGRGVPLNTRFLESALAQSGPWRGQPLSVDTAWFASALEESIRGIDWHRAGEDVRRFLPAREQASIDLWSADLFLSRLERWVGTAG